MALWTPAAAAGGGLITTSTVTPRASTPPNPAAGNRLRLGTREIPQENEPHPGTQKIFEFLRGARRSDTRLLPSTDLPLSPKGVRALPLRGRARKTRKKVSPSRVRRTLSRNFTKGKPGGVKCVDHSLPLTGACTFFRDPRWSENFPKHATRAVHSPLNRRALV